MGLKNAFPGMMKARAEALISIPGSPPRNPAELPGCRFAPRCPFAETRCWNEAPALRPVAATHLAACHRADEAPAMRLLAADRVTWNRQVDVDHSA
jgi:peptide/nickel transport system ATP-binding protein